jgi:hypothetical protein
MGTPRNAIAGIATAGIIGVLSLAPASVAVAAGGVSHAPASCHVDHHVYIRATSAKRSGSSVKVRGRLGKHLCGGLDDENYKFGKKVKTVTVPKGAGVSVLVNGGTVRKHITVRKLPHYLNAAVANAGSDLFQLTGPRTHVKKFNQVFLS